MNKFTAAAFMGLFAFAAHAQTNPPGANVPPHTPGVATGKAEMAGEAKKDARTQGRVQGPGGDMPRSAEGGAVTTGRAAAAGDKWVEKRDQRRPNASPTAQGGTPK
ncbi:MAG: cell envelope biogenesis protein TolA [Comamonadaceae bacterium]|nr:MAG: cell envelope biogenesis protein TolA [Comamonadaceae bacterium]